MAFHFQFLINAEERMFDADKMVVPLFIIVISQPHLEFVVLGDKKIVKGLIEGRFNFFLRT